MIFSVREKQAYTAVFQKLAYTRVLFYPDFKMAPKYFSALARDRLFMQKALALAKSAQLAKEVPVGALVVSENRVLGEGHNQSIRLHDPCAHAEVLALRHAGQICASYRLTHATLYTTLEPCMMCAGALIHARIRRVVFGAQDPKSGAIVSRWHVLDVPHGGHKIDWEGGVLEAECAQLLQSFFQARRVTKNR